MPTSQWTEAERQAYFEAVRDFFNGDDAALDRLYDLSRKCGATYLRPDDYKQIYRGYRADATVVAAFRKALSMQGY